ncbi:hypothetical protein TRFO_13264 [Tritrichomonas foetus]|uniref:Uncharacterized protein n=1 Tax=Tritrichomonas foetus TaxID=1144522 RepID=A0A1J4L2R2_9EUKA|nr:hypothetical protein TRFO_13264 [Tritrichomonas foetus]|eukprot:OHT16260.1 hypothetical protein TRFO_13264 [Tritrichomonas foetus]
MSKKILPSVSDNRRRTPIHVAVKKGHLNIVQKLWPSNSIETIRDIDGNTPLHYAVFFKQPEIVHFIVSQKSSLIMEENRKGETPLSLAASLNQRENVKFFLSNGGKFRPCESYNAMRKAADNEDIDYIKYLINNGLQVGLRQRKLSIVDYSVEFNLENVVNFFKSQNLIDYNDMVPISLAYACGRRPIFESLFKHFNGKKPEQVLNEFIPNLTNLARTNNRVNLIKQIKKQSYKYSPKDILSKAKITLDSNGTLNDALWKAFDKNDLNTMRLLLEYGANPNSRNNEGNPLLFEAVKNNNLQVMDLLFSFGVNPDKRSQKDKQSPIYLAIVSNKIDILMSFITNGANLFSIDENVLFFMFYNVSFYFLIALLIILLYKIKEMKLLVFL